MNGKEIITGAVEMILLFGIIALALNAFAAKKGFFVLPKRAKNEPKAIKLGHVGAVFGIYLGTFIVLVPLLSRLTLKLFHLASATQSTRLIAVGWMQLIGMALVFFFFGLFFRSQNHSSMYKIWKDPGHPGACSILGDIGLGALTWVISFPLVAAVGQLFDLLIYLLFDVVGYEQVAVRYLKSIMQSPFLLASTLLIIVFAAPVIEELLFRGFLQTWIRQRMGAKAAILLSSLAFACFHLAASQGMGNVTLAASLFVFALYLGFLYERQGSLFAPIGLHATFNAVSALRIVLAPET